MPARRVRRFGSCEIWAKPLADGSLAVALLNRGSRGEDLPLCAGDLGMNDAAKLARDLWAGEDIADFKKELVRRIEPHETILLKIKA